MSATWKERKGESSKPLRSKNSTVLNLFRWFVNEIRISLFFLCGLSPPHVIKCNYYTILYCSTKVIFSRRVLSNSQIDFKFYTDSSPSSYTIRINIDRRLFRPLLLYKIHIVHRLIIINSVLFIETLLLTSHTVT